MDTNLINITPEEHHETDLCPMCGKPFLPITYLEPVLLRTDDDEEMRSNIQDLTDRISRLEKMLKDARDDGR